MHDLFTWLVPNALRAASTSLPNISRTGPCSWEKPPTVLNLAPTMCLSIRISASSVNFKIWRLPFRVKVCTINNGRWCTPPETWCSHMLHKTKNNRTACDSHCDTIGPSLGRFLDFDETIIFWSLIGRRITGSGLARVNRLVELLLQSIAVAVRRNAYGTLPYPYACTGLRGREVYHHRISSRPQSNDAAPIKGNAIMAISSATRGCIP